MKKSENVSVETSKLPCHWVLPLTTVVARSYRQKDSSLSGKCWSSYIFIKCKQIPLDMNMQVCGFLVKGFCGTQELHTERAAFASHFQVALIALRCNSGQQSDHEVTNVEDEERELQPKIEGSNTQSNLWKIRNNGSYLEICQHLCLGCRNLP